MIVFNYTEQRYRIINMLTKTLKLMTHSRGFMNMSRRIIMAVVLGLLLVAPQSFAAQITERVGVVDSGKILQLLPDTKQADTALRTFAAPFQKELERMNLEYQKAALAYRQQGASMTKPAREQKEKDLALKAQAVEKYQQEKFARGGVVDAKQQELYTPIRKKVLASIESIAQSEGFTLVVEKSTALFTTPENDLTFKVMNQLNIK